MEIRLAHDRGRAEHGWLKSRHSFSFGDYYDAERMGFGVLRVINDDRVSPGAGFPTHPHRNMEIISYVVEGELEHRDTLGNGSVIRPGEVQRMSAGTGIAHSERNASNTDGLRFLQIWIEPAERGTAPGYEQRAFAVDPERPLRLVVSPSGSDGSVRVGQDARIYRGSFVRDGQDASHTLPEGRSAFVQVVRGALRVRAQEVSEGDAVLLPEGGEVRMEGAAGSEVLLFDLPEVEHG
ncbi:MAG: pirin family protein [Myxococcales bacterium]|nr:pirin family protein [Myxococcales bacterium]MDD9967481.1 pirin family protein [Myxococcales bacterium]